MVGEDKGSTDSSSRKIQIAAAKLRRTLDMRLGRETPQKALDLANERDEKPDE